jgi:RND family efflux transporter MFP subunit
MPTQSNFITLLKKRPVWHYLAALAVLVATFFLFRPGHRAAGGGSTFTARRGPLAITVVEGGNLSALESQEIKCEVRVGYQGTKILKIVEEGYQVTDDDVKTGKVLVELDASDIQKQLVQQEIQYQSAAASYADAQQGYEIQLNQNVSDIKAAEQKARFARMDFEKYLGNVVAEQLIAEAEIGKQLQVEAPPPVPSADKPKPGEEPQGSTPPQPTLLAQVNSGVPLAVAQSTDAPKTITLNSAPASSGQSLPNPQPTIVNPDPQNADTNVGPTLPTFTMPKSIVIDFTKYADLNLLGDGEAKQKLRKFEDDLQVAKKELGQATSTLEGTRRLFDRQFVTKTDLQRDEIAFENSRLKVQTADTARDLYIKYEFVKASEEFLSKYAEAVRELDRANKAARSKLAQAEAKLKSAQAQYTVQLRQRKELQEQLDKCVIRAKKPGLVVYGGGRDDMFYYGEERIREGATVRERQAIITIPDLTRMAVNVKIHESHIKKIKKGMKANIRIDAFPDQPLSGEVTKVGVLPDSQNRWMNPDMKVYLTTITIDGTHDWLKPGMSAKVEVLVNELPDVVYVPVQAVNPEDGEHVCYLASAGSPKRRVVEVGEFNDEFIEVKKGLKEGDKVLLRAPESEEGAAGGKKDGEGKVGKGKPDKGKALEQKKPAVPATPSAPGRKESGTKAG